MNTLLIFRVILASIIVALGASPIFYWVTNRLGWLDKPESAPHKLHDNAVSIAGGLVLLTSIVLTSILQGPTFISSVKPILLPACIVFLFGLWDDLKNLMPLWKLAGQIIAAVLLIYLGIQIRLFQNNTLNYALTVLWIVGITNAYNFVDSMDGLAIGLAGLAATFFFFATLDSQQPSLTIFSAILIGVCLGVFFFNTAPAYYFLGDSGAQLLGFILAAVSIAFNPLGFKQEASWYIPILLAGVPIFDAALIIISRFRRRIPIYKAGRDHTYHRLVGLGLSSNRTIVSMHLAAILLGCLAFVLLTLTPILANTIFLAVISVGGIGIWLLDRNYPVKTLTQPKS